MKLNRKHLIAAAAVIAVCVAAPVTAQAVTAPSPVHHAAFFACVSGNGSGSATSVTGHPMTCPAGSILAEGDKGTQGPAGPAGKDGAPGKDGTSGTVTAGLAGAYYAVARYDTGDTNGGAIATVACKAATDVAVSGGVQTLALGTNGIKGNVPVSSSFPGRMDWTTNAPISGRLDGWIVQFGGNSSATDLGSPKYVDVYALCVPGAPVPVDVTYTESGS